VLEVLKKNAVITEETVRQVQEFISNNQTAGGVPQPAGINIDILYTDNLL
jgi:hypothetical protein